MADIVFVLVALVFFGLCAAYVRALDRMAGANEEPNDGVETAR